MREGGGCDMRGMLSFQILWLLSKGPAHGEMLAEEIGKRRGDKPKAGTIYPALKDLNEKGLIKGDKKGREIIYSLTSAGEIEVKRARAYFIKSFGDMFRSA